jgi:phospholipid/cholesterol/gamma-HCH transport system substrate-binding protein
VWQVTRTLAGRLVDRFGLRTVLLAAAAVLVAVAGVTTVAVVSSSADEYRITAQFRATPGLYPDNAVDILGVPTGHVVSVTPHPAYVEVVLALPASVKVPANAKAVLMAPNPVSDRFVELTPPYTDKTRTVLRDGAVIPLARTVVPLELDQIYDSVSDLSTLLGPGGANKHGELSSVLHAFAQLADGNGRDLHTAVERIAAALPALTAHPNELRSLVDGLDALTTKLAARDSTINALYGDLAGATTQLADERQTLSAAIANLQRGLAEVAAFIRTNEKHLGGAVKNLNTTIGAVMSEQKALIQTFDTAALGFQNFNRTIQPGGPCESADGAPHDCTLLWGRLDLPVDAWPFVAKYCGDSVLYPLLPILAANAGLAEKSATDTACGAEIGLLSKRTGPPGSPRTPDLDLSHFLGTR